MDIFWDETKSSRNLSIDHLPEASETPDSAASGVVDWEAEGAPGPPPAGAPGPFGSSRGAEEGVGDVLASGSIAAT